MALTEAQVRRKVRKAVKRREAELEADEIEGGEINLVPYLDIVTNLMLFMLATVSASFIIGQINTTLPDHVPSAAAANKKPNESPDEKPLQLVVSATQTELILWSISKLEGTLENPAGRFKRVPTGETTAPVYEYDKLNKALYDIAKRRWAGKFRKRETYEVILMPDGDIPYETVVALMDAMRRVKVEGPEQAAKFTKPVIDDTGNEYKPYKYDPNIHPLFDDIVFSSGFE